MAMHGRRAVPGGVMQPPVGRGGGNKKDEESIFNLLTEGRREAQRKPAVPVVAKHPGGPPKQGTRMHQNSDQVANFINPHEGPRRPSKVDYTKANRVAVKDSSAVNHMKKMHDAVDDRNPRGASGRNRTSAGTCFGRPQVPPPAAAGLVKQNSGKDYIRQNKAHAAANKPASREAAPSDHDKVMTKQDYGRVPEYLKARKQEMQMQAEADAAAIEAAKIPPGMRMMPEDERRETLAILAENKRAVESKIMQLPFNIETPSQIKYKNGLDARLQEIEDAERLFSRPNVLVHI